MKPGSVKIIDRVSAIAAIKRLNEEDLLFLNRLIVERLKLISQSHATTLMTSFTKGDRVGSRLRTAERWKAWCCASTGRPSASPPTTATSGTSRPACCASSNQQKMSNVHDPPIRKFSGKGQGGTAAVGALLGRSGLRPRGQLRHSQPLGKWQDGTVEAGSSDVWEFLHQDGKTGEVAA